MAEIPDVILISYHESGHATTQYLLGRSLSSVEIYPLKGRGSCSSHHYPDFGSAMPALWIPEIESDVLIACSGDVAEYILAGVNKIEYWCHDYAQACAALEPICESKEEIRAYLQLLWTRAWDLLRKPRNWFALEKLAHRLVWCPELPSATIDWHDPETDSVIPMKMFDGEFGRRAMDGKEAEEILKVALEEYERTHPSDPTKI